MPPFEMSATKHCCYGLCPSDSRYAHRPYMKNIAWIRFPKSHCDFDKCQRWIRACGREDFAIMNVKKDTYICSKHFVDKLGPTDDHPDPIPALLSPEQVPKFSRRRKASTQRDEHVKKKEKLQAAEGLLLLFDAFNNSKKIQHSEKIEGNADNSLC